MGRDAQKSQQPEAVEGAAGYHWAGGIALLAESTWPIDSIVLERCKTHGSPHLVTAPSYAEL